MLRELTDRANGEREKGSENDFGPFVERLLRRLLRAGSIAAVVLHQELNVGAVEFRNRELGRIAHGLAGHERISCSGKRQDEPDLHLAVANVRGSALGGGFRRGRAAQQIAEREIVAGTRSQHGCEQHARNGAGQTRERSGGLKYSKHHRSPRWRPMMSPPVHSCNRPFSRKVWLTGCKARPFASSRHGIRGQGRYS
jgi:hypothetical protein